MCAASLVIHVLSLTILFFVSPINAFGFTSYPNVFFAPNHVLNNTWFSNSFWAAETAEYWAKTLMETGPWSVTNKTILPRSNDTHDYLSYAVYYWPNCSNVDNSTELTQEQVWDDCEYYNRDGVFNPDINDVQNTEAVNNLTDSIYLAAMAYVATNSSVYAQHINDAIDTFFVNPDTMMNPNLEYSQVVRGPGNQTGKHTGVLDMKVIAKVVSGVELLRASGASQWLAATDSGLNSWAKDMATWLETDELAIEEKSMKNNHGTYYYNQLCSLYVLLNETTSAVSALEEFYNSTFMGQISANGDQPLESIRTRPYHYRAYNLAALVTNAQIGDQVGLSPSAWNRTTSSGATLLDALNFAMAQDPAAHNETDESKQLNPIIAAVVSQFGDPTGNLTAFLKKTDPFYPAQPYFALAEGLSDGGVRQGLIHTTYGPPAAQQTHVARRLG
ncbi:MAG: hypothetical protein TREMPRED_004653 [Tremellales sp. Tagirdzhanova-0007]|nr:MAG: hypothetical protein TREMPRED_004653 [Tremellales sp. Tagirdzhanova-0007]